MRDKIRVLVVDDSMLFRKLLIDRLGAFDNIEIVGYAINASDAEKKIQMIKPDVVTLDVEMPGMSGIDFLKRQLAKKPIPVILVSSLNISVFSALSAGAIDFVKKPDMSANNSVDQFILNLRNKIMVAKRAKVKTNLSPSSNLPNQVKANFGSSKLDQMVVAIGASTGGTEAIAGVITQLPKDTPGIVIVQHMPEGFTAMYAKRMNSLCEMEVKEAEHGDKIQRGRIIIAHGDNHMKVVKAAGGGYMVHCLKGDKVSGHRPSVDVLFRSVAETVGPNAVGIILTGMGKDGADGLLQMKKRGAYTLGQDEESSVVYGMPMVAYNIGAVTRQGSLREIPNLLKGHLNRL